ncbi:Homeobox protein knotted-1-like 6 [Striga hermonthica]|uniref:Homeobox protein knotted-1-like 6 n=1 Tax=Striga hermonthica TaxID=68872 RepID=A0A9N7MSB4_STRHE|nr:Homeobox protein knotted-1-like 6 [Striga hermonthica]
MDAMYGLHSAGDDYSDKALMSPDNLMSIAAAGGYYHDYDPLIPSADHHRRINPPFESEDYGLIQCSAVSESVNSVSAHRTIGYGDGGADRNRREDDGASYAAVKAKIAAHPCYPKLLDAYIDCQKVGAPPEIACLLDEIRREKDAQYCKQDDAVSTCLGVDPELDEFMESYCDVLVKYKRDLSRPFDEATSFLNNIETQLANLCKDEI